MSMTETVLNISEIVSDPKVRRGRPVIKGTGLRVMDIVGWHNGGMSVEQMAEDFRLTLGQVHAALAYYYLHKDEIEADSKADLEAAEQYAKELQAQGKKVYLD